MRHVMNGMTQILFLLNRQHTPTGVSQQQLDQLSSQLPRVQQRQANSAAGPEATLKWLDGEPVEQWQLRRLVGLPSVWTVHDLIWNQQVRR
jgi:hypothetical protein